MKRIQLYPLPPSARSFSLKLPPDGLETRTILYIDFQYGIPVMHALCNEEATSGPHDFLWLAGGSDVADDLSLRHRGSAKNDLTGAVLHLFEVLGK
jgi:hypothetical protein